MAAYWPSPAVPQKPHAQGAPVAEAIRNAADVATSRLVSLRDLLRRTFRKQRSSTPLLQFSDDMADETTGAEAPPWDGYDECGAAGLEMASRVNELHSAAAKCLDAADYALARLRNELAAVAPGILGANSLQPSAPGQFKPAPPYARQPVSEYGGLAAA